MRRYAHSRRRTARPAAPERRRSGGAARHVGRAGVVTGLAVGTALGAYALAGDAPGVVIDAQAAGSVRSLPSEAAKPWEQDVLSLLERPAVELAELPPVPAFQQLSSALGRVEDEVRQYRSQARARRLADVEAVRVVVEAREQQRRAVAAAQAEEAARQQAAAAAEAARVAAEQQAAEAARLAAAQAEAQAAHLAAEQQAAMEAAFAAQVAPTPVIEEPAPVPAPPPAPAPAFAPVAVSMASAELRVLDQLNGVRASVGLPPLALEAGLVDSARAQAGRIASSGSLFHQDLHPLLGMWGTAGENVGYGPDVEVVHGALVASPGHYANMVNGSFTHVGVAVSTSADGRVWVAQVFAG